MLAKFKDELHKIALKCNSFEEFINKVMEWFGILENPNCFRFYLESIAQLSKNNVEITLANVFTNPNARDIRKTYDYNTDDLNFTWTQISQTIDFDKKSWPPVLEVIALISQYQSFDFCGNTETKRERRKTKSKASNKKTIAIDDLDELLTASNSQNSTDGDSECIPVKLGCFPEIPDFESKLGLLQQYGKSWPIEKKVKFILQAMGLKHHKKSKQDEIQDEILRTAVVLITADPSEVSPWKWVTRLAAKAGFYLGTIYGWYDFFEFVNAFLKQHGYDMNSEDFYHDLLNDLRTIVMTGCESTSTSN